MIRRFCSNLPVSRKQKRRVPLAVRQVSPSVMGPKYVRGKTKKGWYHIDGRCQTVIPIGCIFGKVRPEVIIHGKSCGAMQEKIRPTASAFLSVGGPMTAS